MTQKDSNPYNTLIDFKPGSGTDIPSGISKVAYDDTIKRTAQSNFDMQKIALIDLLSKREFNVPEYQRMFSWREKQHRQFWSDIERFMNGDLSRGEHDISDVFFSSMYFAVDGAGTYEVVDGQQRLTTINLLLRTILEHLEGLQPKAEKEGGPVARLIKQYAKRIENILYDPIAVGDKPNLVLNKHDEDIFDALIRGPERQLKYLSSKESVDGRRGVATQVSDLIDDFGIGKESVDGFEGLNTSKYVAIYESNQLLLDAYRFYQDRVDEALEGHESTEEKVLFLVNLSNYILHSYYVGEFVIKEADPDFRMRIFEVLNDRGRDLTKIDKIRAVVVNAFFEEEDREKYVGKWEKIVTEFGTDSSRIDDYLSIHLSVMERNIETIGDASSELTNAFSTQNLESDVQPRFRNLEEAREYLDSAREYVDYYKHITSSDLPVEDLNLSKFDSECHEVLVRLNNQRMSLWYPLILELYRYTDKHPEGDEKEFYRTLETVERINLRRLLVGENPNIFQGIFLEALHEIQNSNTEDSNPYETARQHLIDETQSKSPVLFGERFRDTITQAQSWDPSTAKLVLGKMANQWFQNTGDVVESKLQTDKIHLEHVFPQSIVHDKDDPVWLTEFFELERVGDEIKSNIRDYIEIIRKSDTDLTEEERKKQKDIENFVTQGFINDVGNFLLLRDSNNIVASNRPLSEKIPQYYSKEKDDADEYKDNFRYIYPNRYFTPDDGEINRDYLERMIEQYDREENEIDDVDEEVISYFDSFWTYESMKERRVDLIEDILEILSLKDIEDEFGLVAEAEDVRNTLRTQTETEFEKRLSMLSM